MKSISYINSPLDSLVCGDYSLESGTHLFAHFHAFDQSCAYVTWVVAAKKLNCGGDKMKNVSTIAVILWHVLAQAPNDTCFCMKQVCGRKTQFT